MKSIADQVREEIRDQLVVKDSEIVDSARLVEDLGFDELDLVELTMSLEERFNVEILDEDLNSFKTVKDVVEYIEKNKT